MVFRLENWSACVRLVRRNWKILLLLAFGVESGVVDRQRHKTKVCVIHKLLTEFCCSNIVNSFWKSRRIHLEARSSVGDVTRTFIYRFVSSFLFYARCTCTRWKMWMYLCRVRAVLVRRRCTYVSPLDRCHRVVETFRWLTAVWWFMFPNENKHK